MDNVYFSATDWVTIDHGKNNLDIPITILNILTGLLYLGLSRLPLAFGPTVTDRVKFGRRVDKIDYSKSANKVTFSWRNNYRDRDYLTAEYDYALVAAPFSMVRKLRKPSLTPPPQQL